MTKLAYLECPTGIAGDMCLGALVDAGVPLAYLVAGLSRLGNSKEFQLRAEKVHRNGQQATKIHVEVITESGKVVEEVPDAVITLAHPHPHPHPHPHSHPHPLPSPPPLPPLSPSPLPPHPHHSTTRHLPEIEQLILAAGLPSRVETWSLAIFWQLAEAEGAVHGTPPEQVHFHEVGAVDAIVDIVGTCLGLDWLGIDQVFCSALPTGGGTVWTAHGRLPVPAPAVLKLFELRQIPIYSNGIERELVTPTGAAIATTLATHFGPPPPMTLRQVGLGAGSIDLPLPNILRLWLGEREDRGQEERGRKESQGGETGGHGNGEIETIALLETQIDDLNPQAIGYLHEVLFGLGALDVFTQAIAMKKSRSGTLLTVVCRPGDVAACETAIFRETTTLGIRRSTQQRRILRREIRQVQTEYGAIRVKVAWVDGQGQTPIQAPINVQPEYEDCAAIARQHSLPWREVHRVALQTWYESPDPDPLRQFD